MSPERQQSIKGTRRWFYLLVAMAVVSWTALLVYSTVTSRRMTLLHAPLVDAAMEIKLQATSAHLWFEEVLQGDTTETLEGVLALYAEAAWYARAMLEGGENEEGAFLPLTDPELRSLIEGVLQRIIEFENATAARYDAGGAVAAGTALDVQYDRLFRSFVDQADDVESRILQMIKRDQSRFFTVQLWLGVLSLLFFVVVGGTFYRVERSERRYLIALEDTRAQLQESEQKFRTVADFTYGWEYWIDPQGRFLYSSPGCRRVTGYPPEAFLNDADLLENIIAAEDKETWGRHLEDGPPHTDAVSFRIASASGEQRWVEHSCQEVVVDGESLGRRGSNRDITSRRTMEEERRALETQVQHAQKLESLGVLAGGIAHDFNNLLMGVMGNAELALMSVPPESPVVSNLQAITQAAARAADLAKQMLAYSGKGRFVVEAIDINVLVEEMTYLLETVVSKKAVLNLRLADNLPRVEADATQVRQVFMNLVTNASEAIGERSGVITIATGVMEADQEYLREVYLDDELEPGYYTYFEVTDTGCGMDEETAAKVFDPFFTTKFTGRGLGMAAVLGIVRGHNGAIKIYTEAEKGSNFKVLLPSLSETPDREPQVERGVESLTSWQGSGTILVVDDEESVRSVAKMTLERFGFDVLLAEDGREAVRIFEARANDIVAVILDMTMPHMGGEDTFRELLRIQPDVVAILSSGYNEQEVTSRFVGKGTAGFIQKPYRPLDLIEMVRGVL